MTAYISRYIERTITEDIKRKMVFIGGPRQTGKTTLAKHLCAKWGFDVDKRYLNRDSAVDRENFIRERFPADPDALILDEAIVALLRGIRNCVHVDTPGSSCLRRLPGTVFASV